MPRANTKLNNIPTDHTYVLDNLIASEVVKTEQSKKYHLISISIPDIIENNSTIPEHWFNVVDSNNTVTYGVTYTAFPIKFNGASMSSDGSIDKAAITVANVSREIMYYVELCNGLRGRRVKIKTVFQSAIDANNLNAHIEDEYLIDTYQATEQTVTFQLDPIIDLDIKLPRRRFMADSCYWIFGDPTSCRYVPNTVQSPSISVANGVLTAPDMNGTDYWVSRVGQQFKFIDDPDSIIYSIIDYVYYSDVATPYSVVSVYPDNTTIAGRVTLDISDTTTCLKNLASCREHGNDVNFGAFPGISGSRRVML